MKLTARLTTALAVTFLTLGCGNRNQQQGQAQPLIQPLVGDKPSAMQPAALAQAPPPAQPSAPAQAPSVSGSYQRVQPAAQTASPSTNGEPAPAALSIPAGTLLDVRLEETIDTRRNRAGDSFTASLAEPVAIDGQTRIPRGTRFTGHLIESRPSGRLKGHAELSLSLDSFDLNGRPYEIRTTHVARASGGHKKRNWTLIGGGSGLGTALGAIAGGPAGALIGAGAGAGAGTAGAVITGKKNVRLPVETALAFTLREPVALAN